MRKRLWLLSLMLVVVGALVVAPALAADKVKVKVKEGGFFTLTCPESTNAVGGQATFFDKRDEELGTLQGVVQGNGVRFGPAPKKTEYAVAELNCVPVETTTSSTTTSSTTSTTLPPATQADLRVVKFGPAEAQMGELIRYRINVANLGPDPTTRVIVTDTLPEGVEFVSVSALGINMTCPVTSDNQVICELSGTVGPNQTTDIYIEVRPTTTAFGGWTNQVDVRSDLDDPNVANNRSTATTAVAQPAEPDLGVTSQCPDTVQSSTTSVFQCSFTVTNYGPGTASNTTFRAYSTSFARFNGYQLNTQGSCQIFNGNTEIICEIPSINAGEQGEQVVITTNMSPAGFGTDDVVSSVNHPDYDSRPDNNVYREPLTVTFF